MERFSSYKSKLYSAGVPLRIFSILALLLLLSLGACVTEAAPPRVDLNVTGNSRIYPPWNYRGQWRSTGEILIFQRPPQPAFLTYRHNRSRMYHIARMVSNPDGSLGFEFTPANFTGIISRRTFRLEGDVLKEILPDGEIKNWNRIKLNTQK